MVSKLDRISTVVDDNPVCDFDSVSKLDRISTVVDAKKYRYIMGFQA